MKENKVLRISLAGGLIGALTTNPRLALETSIQRLNDQGWNATHFEVYRTTNLFILFLQIATLTLTLGLFTWGGGYLVLLERDT